MESHNVGAASTNTGGSRRPLIIEVCFGRASSTVSSDTGDWFAELASPAASEEMKGGLAKQRPSFLASAPHPSSRWECSRKDSDVAEGDLEQGAHDAPTYKRTGSLSSVGSVSSSSHHMSVAERWKNMAAQIVYSPVARFYYAFMICITLFEIGVTLYDPHHAPHTRWFIGLELFMVAMLMNEVIVRFIAEGSSSSFFRDRSNLFDILVAKVCLGTCILVVINPYAFDGVQEWIPVAAVRVRDTLRLLRLVFLFKNQRKAQANAGVGMVLLRSIDLHDDHHPVDEPSMFDEAPSPTLFPSMDQSHALLSLSLSPTMASHTLGQGGESMERARMLDALSIGLPSHPHMGHPYTPMGYAHSAAPHVRVPPFEAVSP
jgi:hypothetical protein